MAFSSWTTEAIKTVGNIDTVLINSGLVISSALSPVLKTTLFLFALGVLVIGAIKYQFSEESVMEGVSKMLMFLLLIGAINMALTPKLYDSWMKGVYGGFTSLSQTVGGGGGGPALNQSGAKGVLVAAATFNAVSQRIHNINADIETLRAKLGWKEVGKSIYYFGLEFKLNLFNWIISVVALLQILIFIYISLWASFYIGIAVAFGPVAIITYAFPPLSYLADGWLRFAIGAGLIKVVAVIAMSLYGNIVIASMASAVPDFMSKPFVTPEESLAMAQKLGLGEFMALLVYAIPALLILVSAPTIADKLMSGTRVGGGMAPNPIKLLRR